MAVTTPRLVGAVLAMAVLGVAGGYGAGVYTQTGVPAPSGQALPIGDVKPPLPSPLPNKKTPKPNNTEPLDPDKVEYRRHTFVAKGAVDSTITVEVPHGWEESEPDDDMKRYTDGTRLRWVRVRSGNQLLDPPTEMIRRLLVNLRSVNPAEDLRMAYKRDGTLTHEDGTKLTISTIAYTYIPDDFKKYVLVRWVGFEESKFAAVEIGVIGLPQDLKALEAILDHATKTVRRKD